MIWYIIGNRRRIFPGLVGFDNTARGCTGTTATEISIKVDADTEFG
jgi:hypothetical protein